MAKKGKKYNEVSQAVDSKKVYTVDEAIKLIEDTKTAKFDETVDVSV